MTPALAEVRAGVMCYLASVTWTYGEIRSGHRLCQRFHESLHWNAKGPVGAVSRSVCLRGHDVQHNRRVGAGLWETATEGPERAGSLLVPAAVSAARGARQPRISPGAEWRPRPRTGVAARQSFLHLFDVGVTVASRG